NLWRQVLEYFDAYLIGLTATPSKQTIGFFKAGYLRESNGDRCGDSPGRISPSAVSNTLSGSCLIHLESRYEAQQGFKRGYTPVSSGTLQRRHNVPITQEQQMEMETLFLK